MEMAHLFAANQVDDIAYDGNWAAHTMPNNSGDQVMTGSSLPQSTLQPSKM